MKGDRAIDFFNRLLRPPSAAPAPDGFDAPLVPETPFTVIGDIHGRADLLHRIVTDLCELPVEGPMICVGDYIDRGDDSKDVLDMLHALCTEPNSDFVCLMGNHEALLLDFLDDPVASGKMWLRNGGLQTLASYGLSAVGADKDPVRLHELRAGLAEAMGTDLQVWLRDLPLSWQSGNVFVSHAGAAPRVPLDAQTEQALMWGGSEHYATPRADGHWVIHGHVTVSEPGAQDGRIAIDTGAYATGVLTAAIVQENNVHFRST